MIMIRAIVRPEKVEDVLSALLEAGFPAVTKLSVYGRGKQRGLKVGDTFYDELFKEMLMIVVEESDKDFIIRTIVQTARTGDSGALGDGKIFVTPVDEVYTISSGTREDAEQPSEPTEPSEVAT